MEIIDFKTSNLKKAQDIVAKFCREHGGSPYTAPDDLKDDVSLYESFDDMISALRSMSGRYSTGCSINYSSDDGSRTVTRPGCVGNYNGNHAEVNNLVCPSYAFDKSPGCQGAFCKQDISCTTFNPGGCPRL